MSLCDSMETWYKCLDSMARLVRQGDISGASELGNAMPVPLAVSRGDLILQQQISRGSESTVWSATLRGRPVAVKKAIIRTSADLERFRREVAILGSLSHPAVVPLLGARVVPPDYSMIIPLYTGSLEDKIHTDGWRPEWPTVVDVAWRLAKALQAVHAAGYVHRDVKPGNVLVAVDGAVVLADFGISDHVDNLVGTKLRSAPSGGFHKDRIVGTLQYLGPEVLRNNYHTQASDVYAFAIMMNEVATGVFPFSDCTKDNPACHTVLEMGYGHQELCAAVAAEHLRPCLPTAAPPLWSHLIQQCWDPQPAQRPSFDAVIATLATLRRSLEPPPLLPLSDASVRVTVNPASAPKKAAALAVSSQPLTHRQGDAAPPAAVPEAGWEALCEGQGSRPAMVCGSYADAGLRGSDKMEDRHVVASPMYGGARGHLLAVLDGHRGAAAADFVAAQLPGFVLDGWADAASGAQLLEAAVLRCEACFLDAQREEWDARVRRMGRAAAGAQSFPGCTALALMQVGGQLVCANVGDCRAVLCSAGRAVALTRDHTVDDDRERERIVASGGAVQVAVDGTWRVGAAGLQVSRSIGDGDVKGAGVVATPEMTVHTLTDADEFVVLASDGLWDKVSNEEVVALVHDTVKNPSMAAKRLAMEALTRGTRDNVTVVVCFLKDVGTLESIYKDGCQKYRVAKTLYGSREETLQAYAGGLTMDEVMDQY